MKKENEQKKATSHEATSAVSIKTSLVLKTKSGKVIAKKTDRSNVIAIQHD